MDCRSMPSYDPLNPHIGSLWGGGSRVILFIYLRGVGGDYNEVIELFMKEDSATVTFAGKTTAIRSTLENM